MNISFKVNDVNIAAILKEHGGNFEAQDEAGRTPLMTAVWASNYDIAYFLLEDIGVQPNEIDYEVSFFHLFQQFVFFFLNSL